MLGGHVVHQDGGRFPDGKTVSHTPVEVDAVAPFLVQFDDHVAAIGWRAAADIESHIHDSTKDAIDELGVIGGRRLEVHPADHIRTRYGVEGLGEGRFQERACEHGMLEHLDEMSARIGVHRKADFVTPGDYRFNDFDTAGRRQENSITWIMPTATRDPPRAPLRSLDFISGTEGKHPFFEGPHDYGEGSIDEARLSGIARSADWILTE